MKAVKINPIKAENKYGMAHPPAELCHNAGIIHCGSLHQRCADAVIEVQV
jgi:hypothetical protein